MTTTMTDQRQSDLTIQRTQTHITCCCNTKQDNVQVNTESVQCISIAYSEVRITEMSEQITVPLKELVNIW